MNYNLLDIIENLTDKEIAEAFGSSLKELRAHTAITQKQLSDATQVPRQSISVYERGEVAPTITQAMRITHHFSLSIDDFVFYGMGIQQVLDNGLPVCGDIAELYDIITIK